jgi:hypothetical protein
MSNSSLPLTHKCAVHGMVAAYLNLASQLLCEQPVCQYISEVFIEYIVKPIYFRWVFIFSGNNFFVNIENVLSKISSPKITI